MNALSASIIFVIWAFVLSTIKQMLFPSDQIISRSQMGFQKVFHLTNSKVQPPSSSYKSLYEAYYRSDMMDAKKYTSMLKDRQSFNQSILTQSFLNDEKSFMCGPNFTVMVFSGITAKNTNMQWVNLFQVYQLPLMKKLDQITIFGQLQLPEMCKNQKQPGKYQIGVINQNRPLLLTIDNNGKFILYSNILQYLDEYSKQIVQFDYSARFWAYTSKEQPWVVRIAQKPFSKEDVNIGSLMNKQKGNFIPEGLYETNNFLQIDLLDIEMYETDSYDAHQILNIRQILINNLNNLYLTCVYDYHNTRDKINYIIQTSFMIEKQTMSLLSRVVLQSYKVTGTQVATNCVKFLDPIASTYDLSCLIKREDSDHIDFVSVLDIFNINSSHKINKKKSKKNHEENTDGYSEWIQDHFKDIYDSSQDDFMWMLQKMTPLADKSYFPPEPEINKVNMYTITFKSPAETHLKILKPSLPDPIFLYNDVSSYYLYSFKVSPFTESSDFQQGEGSPSPKAAFTQFFFKLDKPTSNLLEQSNLRNIRWDQDEQLMMVMWGNGIQLYQYYNKSTPQLDLDNNESGIAMSAMLPFIELFATVFCMLQMVWNTS